MQYDSVWTASATSSEFNLITIHLACLRARAVRRQYHISHAAPHCPTLAHCPVPSDRNGSNVIADVLTRAPELCKSPTYYHAEKRSNDDDNSDDSVDMKECCAARGPVGFCILFAHVQAISVRAETHQHNRTSTSAVSHV